MKFLYPTSRQFPFDEVCEKIVRELEKRNWEVPGITVEFENYGRIQQFRYVGTIKSQDFKLRFCRRQGILSGEVDCGYNNIAAVANIIIPMKDINVHADESGPSFYLYVGKNWDNDRENFRDYLKVHSKLNHKPRTYLRYTGAPGTSNGNYRYGQRLPLLVHDNDCGREYDPEDGEPKSFKTAEVMQEFKTYLEDVVLKSIMSHTVAEKVDVV